MPAPTPKKTRTKRPGPQAKATAKPSTPATATEAASATDASAEAKETRRSSSPADACAHGVVDWRPAYLAALEKSARKAASAEAAGVTLRSVQRRRLEDAEFAAAEKAAMTVAVDIIEDEVTRRAVEGIEEPVFGSGGKGRGTVQVGTIRKFSDTLLLRLAERTETGSWRQRQQIETGKPGAFDTRADLLAAARARDEKFAAAKAAMAADAAGSTVHEK